MCVFCFLVILSSLTGFQPTSQSVGPLADPFPAGRFLVDTNNDGLIDSIAGKVVVPDSPSAVENAAAANVAARLGHLTTGLTLPIAISPGEERGTGPRIWIGADAVPSRFSTVLAQFTGLLEAGEGGVFALEETLAAVGKDDAGLQAAAEALASRVPFIWKVPGDRLVAIVEAVPRSRLEGVTYVRAEQRFTMGSRFLISYTLASPRDDAPQAEVTNQANYIADWGPAGIDRRRALVASGSYQLPWKISMGLVWQWRSSLALSGSSTVQVDGVTQYVAGTTRNIGTRDNGALLTAVNTYRASLNLAPIPLSQIDSSSFNSFDLSCRGPSSRAMSDESDG